MRVMYQGSLDPIQSHHRIYEVGIGATIRLESWPRQLRRAMENAVWQKDQFYPYVDRPEVDDSFWPRYVARGAFALGLVGLGWLGILPFARATRRA